MESQTQFSTPLNWYRMFFVQTSTPTPNMHRKLTEYGPKFCIHNNQLPAKTHVEVIT